STPICCNPNSSKVFHPFCPVCPIINCLLPLKSGRVEYKCCKHP
ncbi:unnamed protein product, partial [Musa acuminata subsp. malaccensis]